METCDRCKHNAYMVFYTGTETEKLCVFCTRELLPKMFARVRELEDGIRKHRELATNAINVCDCLGDKNLWALISPAQEVRDGN